MKKRTAFRMISVLLGVFALIAVLCAATVTGSGFLDLSNIARVVFAGIAVVCAGFAILFWKSAKR